MINQRLTAIGAVASVITTVVASAAPSLTPGEPFPLFPLPLIDAVGDGELRSLADFRGHKTVVHIFAGW